MTTLQIGRDVSGVVDYSRKPSSNKFSATLTQDTDTTVTVPVSFSGSNWKVFIRSDAGTDVWVAIDEEADVPAAPTGGELNECSSECNPGVLILPGGAVIHLKTTNTTANVGVAMYEQQ
jgi:hypothetical protein